jgi:hormone-sensitive lipase
MQVYTRKWANELGVPVFSVDYRMPPDHPFPDGPNDCLTAYRFIINRVHEYLNIRPTKVYLAGDSAGGNLACALMTLILKHKEPIPQGIYLTYPAADLRNTFTSSRVHSLTDPLLWPRTLFLCVNSYLKDDFEKANDPLASPVLLTEEYVGGEKGDMRFPLRWPRTLIDVGNHDPLFDDSLILMQRMVESNIDCECIVYDKFSHGFLNIGFMVKESNKTITNSIAHWKKLM